MDDPKGEQRGIKRIRQACQNCRRKKTRCPGERPVCSFCTRLGQECNYDSTDDYRNGGPHPDTEDALAERIAMLESRLLEMSGTSGQSFASMTFNPDVVGEDMAAYTGASMSIDSSTQNQRRMSAARSETQQSHGRQGSTTRKGHQSNQTPEWQISDYPSMTSPVLASPVSLATQLSAADTYFERCHNQPYTYFAERSFRRRLSDGLIPSHLIYAFIATAARFSEDPAVHGNDLRGSVDSYAKTAWSEILQRSLASDDAPELNLVQTTNLLAAIDFVAGRQNQSWIKVGLAVRLAQDLRLTMEPDPSLSPLEREESRRTFWSVYLLDRLVSCGRNRPFVFRDEDCQVFLPSSEVAFRRGVAEPSCTITRALEGTRLVEPRPDQFALLVMSGSCLAKTAQFMLQQRGDDHYPIWNSRSDWSGILSSLLTVETYMDQEGLSIAEYIRQRLTTGGIVDHQRSGHFLFSRVIFHLAHIILNHPFLLQERLKGLNRPVPGSFIQEALQRCQCHAEQLTLAIEETKSAGAFTSCSYYAYCTVVAGGVHCLNAYHESADIRHRSAELLRHSFAFLKGLKGPWPHIPRLFETLTNLFASAKTSAELRATSNDTRWLLSASFDAPLWWHAVDYSSLSDCKTSPSASPASSEPPADATSPFHRPLQNGHTDEFSAAQPQQARDMTKTEPMEKNDLTDASDEIPHFDTYLGANGQDFVPTSDALWTYPMDETSDFPGVVMPFDSPLWKDFSQPA